MRILFASGRMTYPFIRGGDGTTIDQLLTELTDRGDLCLCAGLMHPKISVYDDQAVYDLLRKSGINYVEDHLSIRYQLKYECVLFKDGNIAVLLSQMVDYFSPDIIITQLEESHEIIKQCKRMSLPVVLYVHDVTEANHQSLSQKGISHIFYNSNFTQNHFRNYSAIPNTVIYPVFDSVRYKVVKGTPRYITFVNPSIDKGIEVFQEVIQLLPHLPFQVVSGWNTQYFDTLFYPNLRKIPFSDSMREVYSSAAFMIIPSQWEESFCRIPVEAGFSGTPSIASAVGGLPESMGNSGVLISDFKNPIVWAKEIETVWSMPDPSPLIQLANSNAARFSSEEVIARIRNLLLAICR